MDLCRNLPPAGGIVRSLLRSACCHCKQGRGWTKHVDVGAARWGYELSIFTDAIVPIRLCGSTKAHETDVAESALSAAAQLSAGSSASATAAEGTEKQKSTPKRAFSCLLEMMPRLLFVCSLFFINRNEQRDGGVVISVIPLARCSLYHTSLVRLLTSDVESGLGTLSQGPRLLLQTLLPTWR